MNPFALDGTCRNMRDLGGWSSYDGRKVRQNLIVRAMAFDDGSGTAAISTDKTSDCQQFLCNYLGIEYDFDLRPGSQTYVRGATWLDASVDYTYLWDVESPHAARVIQLANRNYRPAYVHCQAGKDRTGIVCYLTLLALGVSENDAKKDYETEPLYNPSFRQLIHVSFKVAAELKDEYLPALVRSADVIGAEIGANLGARHVALLFR